METEIKEKKLFKIVNKSGHHGFIYKEGWNIDPLPFNPTGSCKLGGIYFTGKDILAFLGYGESVYEVTNYSTPYENPGIPKKYKAHEVELRYIGECNNVEVVKYLIENGADIHADGDYVLLCSSDSGHLEVVKYLIDNGVDIHAWNDLAIIHSAKNEHIELVKYLIENGADVQTAIKHSKILGDFKTVSTLEKFL